MAADRQTSEPGSTPGAGWQEEDSALFIDMGEVLTPARDQMRQALIDHVPASTEDHFLAVDIGCGAGWLSEALLERFSNAHVVALDGSPAMLRHAGDRLQTFGDRAETWLGRLEERDWLDRLGQPVRCFLSSLTLHHLDGAGKALLFADLYAHLEPGGAVCLADIIEPASEWAKRHMARTWTEAVRQRSLDLTGEMRTFDFFIEQRWNTYDFPDPDVDMPSHLMSQLRWLTEAGFANIDVPWALAGHTVIVAYRPDEVSPATG